MRGTAKPTSKKSNTAPPSPSQETAQNESQPPSSGNTENKNASPFDINPLIESMLSALGADSTTNSLKDHYNQIRAYIHSKIQGHPVAEEYNILILHDEGIMTKQDADNIYSACESFDRKLPILLVLHSVGGVIGSAYLIGKLCRENTDKKFVVAIPRQAKSAATLICCAADEIHMGSLSELGPIDPQIDGLPALGLKTSVEHIADLVKEYPHASEMFAKYLHLSLKPVHLGYYERVAESAAQYAERLLKLHSSGLQQKPEVIARDLVYSYKDHGFVIDKSEAQDIFGSNVVFANTREYALANDIYLALRFVGGIADMMSYYFYFVGSPTSEPHFSKRKPRR